MTDDVNWMLETEVLLNGISAWLKRYRQSGRNPSLEVEYMTKARSRIQYIRKAMVKPGNRKSYDEDLRLIHRECMGIILDHWISDAEIAEERKRRKGLGKDTVL